MAAQKELREAARPRCAGSDRDTTSLVSPPAHLGKPVAARVRGVKSANHPAGALWWSRESRGRAELRAERF